MKKSRIFFFAILILSLTSACSLLEETQTEDLCKIGNQLCDGIHYFCNSKGKENLTKDDTLAVQSSMLQLQETLNKLIIKKLNER